jgi:hypothetical protein
MVRSEVVGEELNSHLSQIFDLFLPLSEDLALLHHRSAGKSVKYIRLSYLKKEVNTKNVYNKAL